MRTILGITLIFLSGSLAAEPYFAVKTGFACSQCHVNPSGGGKRTVFGAAWAQEQLPARKLAGAASGRGFLGGRLSLGTNFRYGASDFDSDLSSGDFSFDVQRASIYLEAELITDKLTLYVDEQVAPGGAFNRELWGMFRFGKTYVKAGKMFLPSGWRLQDDSAFIRLFTGINFDTPDNGVEIGYAAGPWETSFAVTNGNGGVADNNAEKQLSFSGSYRANNWRLGIWLNQNETNNGDRLITGVYAGLRTGIVSWLAEYDRIEDDIPGFGDIDQTSGFLEANIAVAKGHNLKLSLDFQTTDIGEDFMRHSVLWEYSPIQFTQLRFGYRKWDDDAVGVFQNADLWFAELHLYY